MQESGMQRNRFFYITPDTMRQENNRPKGLLARIRETIMSLATEEAELDRPIGISQLSRNTFQPTASAFQPATVYRDQRQLYDYRFNQLVER